MQCEARSGFASEKRGDPSSPRLRRDKVDLHGDRLSRRSVTKPEAASEARREIARNAPPSVVFYETAVNFFQKKATLSELDSAAGGFTVFDESTSHRQKIRMIAASAVWAERSNRD